MLTTLSQKWWKLVRRILKFLTLMLFCGYVYSNFKYSQVDIKPVMKWNSTEPPEGNPSETPAYAKVLSTTRQPYVDDPALLNYKSSSCPFEEWNNIQTDAIPNAEAHEKWKNEKLGNKNNYLYHKKPSIFAAFAHKTHITVTLTSENYYGKTVFCRYYDCKRREIGPRFVADVFPEATVFCGRRKGAKYISITETMDEKSEISVPIQKRLKPSHFFTVCIATLYGDEPKFLQIADTIEYYKLQGASFFHIYLRNVSSYDRVLLDEYVRNNEVEVIKMHDHFWREDFMWHHVQINDCHHRNKYFAKWTAVIDLDERIEIKKPGIKKIGEYLDSIVDPTVNSVQFMTQFVVKDKEAPSKYIDEKQLKQEMFFHKYHNTSRVGTPPNDQPKCIIRPEKVASMDIHLPDAVYKGELFMKVNETVGVVRHYRNNSIGKLLQLNLDVMNQSGPFQWSQVAPWIDEKMEKAITQRVAWVYDIKEPTCSQKQISYAQYNITMTC